MTHICSTWVRWIRGYVYITLPLNYQVMYMGIFHGTFYIIPTLLLMSTKYFWRRNVARVNFPWCPIPGPFYCRLFVILHIMFIALFHHPVVSWDIADVNMYMYVFNKWRWSRTAGTICHSLCPRDEVYRRAVPATPSDATTVGIGEHRQGPLLLRTSVGWKRTLSGAARDQNVSLNPRNFNWRNFLLCTLLMIWYKFCKFDFRNEYK